MRTAISAASSSAAAGQRARHQQPRRIVADQRPHQMRRDQADEADGAGDGDRAADAERDAEITSSRSRPTSTPRLCAVSSPRLSARKALRWLNRMIAPATMNGSASMTWRKAAILQRAEQPERDLQHHERIAGQIHHQRGGGARKARDRKPRQNQNQQPGIAAGDRQQHEHRGERRGDRRDRKRVGSHIGKPERDHQHRAERRRLRRAEQRRRGQRIAQQPLQCRAGQAREWRRSRTPESRGAAGFPARSPAARRCRRRTSASMTASGDSRTGPIPSEISASNTTRTTSAGQSRPSAGAPQHRRSP